MHVLLIVLLVSPASCASSTDLPEPCTHTHHRAAQLSIGTVAHICVNQSIVAEVCHVFADLLQFTAPRSRVKTG
jgi:hypothetical protein